MSSETYISVDIETDGMVPGLHSMIQLGAVALNEEGRRVFAHDTFERNLQPLPDATRLQSTMDWWAERPEVYAQVCAGAEDPGVVMRDFAAWVQTFPGHLVFVGYPVTFDCGFVFYYLWRFTGGNPFPHGGMDIKTLAMALLNTTYQNARKGQWPKRWLPEGGVHAHTALADAIEQGAELASMLHELRHGGPR